MNWTTKTRWLCRCLRNTTRFHYSLTAAALTEWYVQETKVKISFDEFLFRSMKNATDMNTKSLFKRFDMKKDEKIDFDEFLMVCN
jgi:hypothetical protein